MYIRNCTPSIAPFCRSIHCSCRVLYEHRELLAPVVEELSLANTHRLDFGLGAFKHVTQLTLNTSYGKLPWWNLIHLRLTHLRINGSAFDANGITGLVVRNRKTLQDIRIGCALQSRHVFRLNSYKFTRLHTMLSADPKCYVYYSHRAFPVLRICNSILLNRNLETLQEIVVQRWETKGKFLARIYTARGQNVLALQLMRIINFSSDTLDIGLAAELLNVLLGRGISLGTNELYHMYIGDAVIYDILLNRAHIKLSEFQKQTLVARMINRFADYELQPLQLMVCVKELISKHHCVVPSMKDIITINPSLITVYRYLIDNGARDQLHWITSMALYHQVTTAVPLLLPVDDDDADD